MAAIDTARRIRGDALRGDMAKACLLEGERPGLCVHKASGTAHVFVPSGGEVVLSMPTTDGVALRGLARWRVSRARFEKYYTVQITPERMRELHDKSP
jgi:hypothetical protein